MLPKWAQGNSVYKRSPDRSDVCVCMCLCQFETPGRGGGGQIPKSGWEGETQKEKRVGEERLSLSMTDSCQENESAVCQPARHTHTQTC